MSINNSECCSVGPLSEAELHRVDQSSVLSVALGLGHLSAVNVALPRQSSTVSVALRWPVIRSSVFSSN